jgi:catechol 2,3-dioxygenase-like lactoylglutathione lyase family enzyme
MTKTIIDHVGIKVSDIARSFAFYREALGTLGIEVLADFTVGGERHVGFGTDKPDFWISSGRPLRGETHVAFTASSRSEVQAFHSVALSMGGRDNGSPGVRAHYHPDYYGAYVLDPDGNNVEAVCHRPEEAR